MINVSKRGEFMRMLPFFLYVCVCVSGYIEVVDTETNKEHL